MRKSMNQVNSGKVLRKTESDQQLMFKAQPKRRLTSRTLGGRQKQVQYKSVKTTGFKKLAHYFSVIGNMIAELDKLKTSLVIQKDFDSVRYFRYLASYKQEITVADVHTLVKAYNFDITDEQISQILIDGKVEQQAPIWKYNDFLKYLYTSQDQLQQLIKAPSVKSQLTPRSLKPKKVNFEKLDLTLIMIFIKNNELLIQLDEMRNDSTIQNMNKIECFTLITKQQCIMTHDLIKFLEQQGYQATYEIAKCLLKILDFNQDGKVNYHDFISFLNSNDSDQICPTQTTGDYDNDYDYYLQGPTRSILHTQNNKYSHSSQSHSSLTHRPQSQTPLHILKPRDLGSLNQINCTPLKYNQSSKACSVLSPSINGTPMNKSTLTRFLNPPQSAKNLTCKLQNIHDELQRMISKESESQYHSKQSHQDPFQKTQSMSQIKGIWVQDQQKQFENPEESLQESKLQQKVRVSKQSSHRYSRTDESINENLFEVLDNSSFNTSLMDIKQSLPIKEFQTYITLMINAELQLDSLRIRLMQHPTFDLVEAFKVFDLKHTGLISQIQLKQILQHSFQIIVSEREIVLFMQRYDRDRDGMLRFSDFCEILAPKNPPKDVREQIRQKFMRIPLTSRLSRVEMQDLKLVFEEVISNEMDLEILRYRLSSIDPETNHELPFDTIFSHFSQEKSTITFQDFLEYTKNLNLTSPSRIIKSIFNKFDIKKTVIISKQSLNEELTPKTYL